MRIPEQGWTPAMNGIRVLHLLSAAGLCAILLPIALILIDYARVLRLRRKLPPGPFPIPLFGNHFQVPKYKPWERWDQLSRQNKNPMLTIWNGHRPVIVCHDAWTISDLLEKRASIYCSRPRLVALGDMVDGTHSNQTALAYGDRWRAHRKLMHTVTGSHAVRSHRPFQGDESKILTLDILRNPESFVHSIERYSCSVVSIIGYGRRIDSIEDPVAQVAIAIMQFVNLIIPCYCLVETIPWLLKAPEWLYSFPSKCRKGAASGRFYFTKLYKEAAVKKPDSFSNFLVAGQAENGRSDKEISALTANLIGGGVDTTSSSIVSFILAMCVFPEVQRKAQEEIDRVIGQDRSPAWDDMSSLPYIAACVSETLRWRTVTILGGLPHAPINDDEYKGYFIPAGTAITGNVWSIHRHPREFPAPDSFRPERYLNGLERPYPTKKGHNAFGWGRRVCSGQPLAEQSLWMVVARLLWAYDIRPGLDEQGQEVTLDIFAYVSSENMRPEPFKARFIPRSEKVVELLHREATTARDNLRIYDDDTGVKL